MSKAPGRIIAAAKISVLEEKSDELLLFKTTPVRKIIRITIRMYITITEITSDLEAPAFLPLFAILYPSSRYFFIEKEWI